MRLRKLFIALRRIIGLIIRPLRQAYQTISLVKLKRGEIYNPTEDEKTAVIGLHEKILLENILPYWYPGVLDLKFGGYQTNKDINGNWMGSPDKEVMAQVRALWFFSALCQSKYGNQDYLNAAEFGFRFMVERLWDPKFGGFYTTVSQDGRTVKLSEKHMVNQAFCLNAISMYQQASGDKLAESIAGELFYLIEKNAYDRRFGGYVESMRRDWKPHSIFYTNYMGDGVHRKTMSTQLHLMDAIRQYYLVSENPLAKERLYQMIIILSGTVNSENIIGSIRRFRDDWLPLFRSPDGDFYYDHDLENIWFLMQALDAVAIPNSVLLGFCRGIFDNAVELGYDRTLGGFFFPSQVGGHGGRKGKEAWAQAEALVSALMMHHITNEKRYWDVYRKTLDWICDYQINWEEEEWYAFVSKDGEKDRWNPRAIKGPFHNGRAMLKCIEILDNK